MAKEGFGLSLGKSTQIGSHDCYHENIGIVICISEAAEHLLQQPCLNAPSALQAGSCFSLLTFGAHFTNGQFHIISQSFEHRLQVQQHQAQRHCWNILLFCADA